jgi:DNA replication protein DnaC
MQSQAEKAVMPDTPPSNRFDVNPGALKALHAGVEAEIAAGRTQDARKFLENKLGVKPPPPFVAEFGECERHGKWPMNKQDDQGRTRWFANECPKCARVREAHSLLSQAGVPRRFMECSFSSYEADTDKKRAVLEACKNYAKSFPTNLDRGANLLMLGNPGTGKNHLATAVFRNVVLQGYTVLKVTAAQYLDEFWKIGFDGREDWLVGLGKIDLLMIDEIGRASDGKAAGDAFFRLINARYDAQKPTVVASNLDAKQLEQLMGIAAYDRLKQGGSTRLTFDWESHRSQA